MPMNSKKKRDEKSKTKKSTPTRKGGSPRKDKRNRESKPEKPIPRYRLVQKILSKYCRENGKKLGAKFNHFASIINKATLNDPIKQVENNIDQLYFIYVEGGNVKEFPDCFGFFDFADKLLGDPTFEGVLIGVHFDDGREKFEFVGTKEEMLDYYKANMHKYLRLYYTESPPAYFEISETDWITYVNYEVKTDGRQKECESKSPVPATKPEDQGKAPAEKPTEPAEKPAEPPTKPAEPTEKDKDVEIAKARAREEQAKALTKAMDMLEKKLISPDQFAIMLKSLTS